MISGPLERLLFLSPLMALLVPSVGHAHLGHEVQTAERYLKVDFGDDHVRVVVSLMLGPAEARRVLTVADHENGDADGTLTSAEADAYMARWAEGLAVDLPIEVDGVSQRVSWGEPYLEPVGAIESRTATVEMVARLPLTAGTHHVSLRDAMRQDSLDRTDVAFSAREGAELVRAGTGLTPQDRVTAFAFGRGRGPEVFTAVAELPGSAEEPADEDSRNPAWASLLLVLAALALVAAAAYLGGVRSGRGS